MVLAGGQARRDASVVIVTAGMDVGGQVPPRAGQGLCGLSPVFLTRLRRANGHVQ
jgi:hypothetical protein